MPDVQVVRFDRDGDRSLTLRHVHRRGRPLTDAPREVVTHLRRLVGFPVRLETWENDIRYRRRRRVPRLRQRATAGRCRWRPRKRCTIVSRRRSSGHPCRAPGEGRRRRGTPEAQSIDRGGGRPLKPLSGLDSLFLHLETPETPMHVASLHLYDPPEGYQGDFYADVKRQVARRLHLVPLFRRKLQDAAARDRQPGLGGRRRRRPRPPRPARAAPASRDTGAARGLRGAHPLDADRPQPPAVGSARRRGPEDRPDRLLHAGSSRGARWRRGHGARRRAAGSHAGAARGAAVLRAESAPTATVPGIGRACACRAPARRCPVREARPAAARSRQDADQEPAKAFARARLPRTARRSRAFGPRTPLQRVDHRRAPLRGRVRCSLDEAKRVAHAHDAKLNDVVLAICSGALAELSFPITAASRRSRSIAGMPFSLRESGNTEYSTQATMTLVNLATDIADPVQRLRAIRDAAGAIKSVARRAKSLIPDRYAVAGRTVARQAGWPHSTDDAGIADRLPPVMNVVISNVPGPRSRSTRPARGCAHTGRCRSSSMGWGSTSRW